MTRAPRVDQDEYDADTVDEVNNFEAGGEIEDFDLVNIGSNNKSYRFDSKQAKMDIERALSRI